LTERPFSQILRRADEDFRKIPETPAYSALAEGQVRERRLAAEKGDGPDRIPPNRAGTHDAGCDERSGGVTSGSASKRRSY